MRGVPLTVHTVIEVLAAPAVMAAPFLLGFGEAATVIAFAFGAILLGHALHLEGPRHSVRLSAHASIDYGLAIFAIAGGLALAVATAELGAASFLVGLGAAQAMLTATTRFSLPARA